jgi:hypothetical protein
MSVLACQRECCPHIMCDNILDLSHQRSYYICDECLNELEVIRTTWPSSMTIFELHDQIEAFMNTEKGSAFKLQNNELKEELERILRRRE